MASTTDRETRRCPACTTTKPTADFAPAASRCHSCDREKARAYYAKNRAHVLARQIPQQHAKRAERATQRLIHTDPAVQIWADMVAPKREEPEMANTTARGYGWEHQKLRKTWKVQVDARKVDCARCGQLIIPDPKAFGDGWQLDHDPTDPTRKRYNGPAHTSCNQGGGPPKPKTDPNPTPTTNW